jgi:predicted dehydrogenase
VVGAYDISSQAAELVRDKFPIEHVYTTLDDLLANPEIEIVDIATHPAQRIPLIQRALAAGKHVLAQKPLALDIASARGAIAEAQRRNLKIAVNQNGRWAPAWRIATLLIQQGAIGQVLSITHLYDVNFGWVTGRAFDRVPHWAIYDYSVHWFDITRCWMGDLKVEHVRAGEFRMPHQPPESITPWGMWAEIGYENGANAMIRCVGGSTAHPGGHPFWIHGSDGVIRGSVLGGDSLELENKRGFYHYKLEGHWFPDGFIGTMGELMHAIHEQREPFNSARHNLSSLQMTLAACRSAEESSCPVRLEEIP